MSRYDQNKPQGKKSVKDISPETMKRVAILVANTVILTFIYFGSMGINQPILSAIVTIGYWLGFAGFLIAYVIYNRGFTRKGVTRDMLPDSWSEEKKTAFIEDSQSRYKRSKWMLSVIIPLMVPIALDAINLFTWPIIQNLFESK